MTQEAISIRSLNYSYPDGTKALEDVTIKVESGEKVVIIGPNGAGKTTLFLHLNGTIRSLEDNVNVFGKNIGRMATEERIKEVGIVFQDPDDQLFMPTIFDDVAFGPINMGLDEGEVERRVKKALATVGLLGYEDRVPHHMSYGQKKKAALASVLSMEPRILVLDEPTANLDPRSRVDFIRVINDLNKKEGITIVIAMHDVNALPELSDRVYVLNRRVVAEGSPRKIFSDISLLKENNLEAPEVFNLFKVLRCFGYNCDDLPLSMYEAVDVLTKTIEDGNGHIHLHIHEHTHEEVKKIMYSYNHH
ncbi:MAG: ATP-binding cassette domain-containing protein [Methanosarcinaceae archaeon]|nr:ATP-binding cassette domain-containing protein [Methanosarcinaceae archaeon]